MSAAPLATLAVLTYITAWHEYMWPLVTATRERARAHRRAERVQVLDAHHRAAVGAADGGTFLASLPLIVLFSRWPSDGRRDRLLGDQVMKRLYTRRLALLVAALRRRDAAHDRRRQGPAALQLWDTNQKPVYQKCADSFQQAEPEHPDPDREQELGRLLERLAPRLHRRHAPDVFTDHLGKYPQFAQSQVIEPVRPAGST
jgi:hypothetical protein